MYFLNNFLYLDTSNASTIAMPCTSPRIPILLHALAQLYYPGSSLSYLDRVLRFVFALSLSYAIASSRRVI